MKTEIIEKIKKLKEEKNAIILAHNYQNLEVQKIADFVGDSLELAQKAAKVEADIIVFCGVKFMAETAKLLKPEAKVLLSDEHAGCPMADMITGEQLAEFRSQYPNSVVLCYVNSSVEVKAGSDICCTSSNAVKIVETIPEDKTILFVPDQNLGQYCEMKTGRKITVWKGFCNVHHIFVKPEDVERVRKDYPDYTLIVHPECPPEIFTKADVVGSTKQMVDYVAANDKIILGTETGLFYQLKDKFPEKNIVPLTENAVCRNMKETTLEGILNTLENEKNVIEINPDIAENALSSVQRMLDLS